MLKKYLLSSVLNLNSFKQDNCDYGLKHAISFSFNLQVPIKTITKLHIRALLVN